MMTAEMFFSDVLFRSSFVNLKSNGIETIFVWLLVNDYPFLFLRILVLTILFEFI